LTIQQELCFWGYEVTKGIFKSMASLRYNFVKNGLTKCSSVPRTIVNSLREAGLVSYEESALICIRVDRTAGKKFNTGEAAHIEEEPGQAGKGRVRLVEKTRDLNAHW
jgi:hypothetical protein